jgi:hypothetical protein
MSMNVTERKQEAREAVVVALTSRTCCRGCVERYQMPVIDAYAEAYAYELLNREPSARVEDVAKHFTLIRTADLEELREMVRTATEKEKEA